MTNYNNLRHLPRHLTYITYTSTSLYNPKIAMVNGSSVSTNPNKVIAGHEATNTNELLQALAEAISKKVSI